MFLELPLISSPPPPSHTHTPTHKLSNYLLMSSIILTSSFRLFSLLLLASLLGICFCGSALWVESLAEFSGPTATKLFQYNLRPKERAIFITYFNQATIIFLLTIILLELYYSSSKIMVHRNTVFIREDAKLARNTHRYTYST